jgi:hypothetical protein
MQRSAIIVMHKLGFKESDIVYWVGHDERTINHWINHFDQFNNVEDESRNGRPHATADETDESIASVAQDIRFITPKEIRTRLHLDVSGRTVRRRLDDAGLFGRVARVLFLSHRNTSINDLHSLATTANGMNPNGTLFSSVTRLTSFSVAMVKYGSSAQKIQHSFLST